MTTMRHVRCDARLILAALGILIFLLVLSYGIWGNGEACYAFWRGWRFKHPEITRVACFITDWGNPLAYLVYSVIFIQAVRHCRQDDLRLVLWYVVIQIVFALLLTHLLKNFFGMPRPFAGENAAQPWSFQYVYQSFPSGHTAEIVGAALPLALWRKRLPDALLCGVWIALVAYSRVYLGRHYLMDLWGGLAVGSLAALCILHFARKSS